MNCIYHRWRTKDYKKYQFCTLKKITISDNCKNCLNKQCRKNKPIKKRTNKLNKLEKNRFSIFTKNLKHCYWCHKEENLDMHEVWGGSNRQRCMKNGLCIPICRQCHSNELIIEILKRGLQIEYEKTHTREEFIELIGKSYLD